MIRPLILSLSLLAAPAAAQYYQAQPVAPAAQERFVARENVWRCGEAGCVSNRTSSRPAIVCATLVREVGAVRSFVADGRSFDAGELERCNRRAR